MKSTQDPVKSTRLARRVLRSLAAQLKDLHTKYVLPIALRLQSCMPTGCSESHPTEMGLGSGQLRLSKASVQLPRLETLRNSFQHLWVLVYMNPLSIRTRNNTKILEFWIHSLSRLVRFNTEILEPFKYSNHVLLVLLCWTHQKKLEPRKSQISRPWTCQFARSSVKPSTRVARKRTI